MAATRQLFLLLLLLLPIHALAQEPTYFLPTSNGTIVRHSHYTLSYREDHEQAEWVAYELTREETAGGYDRTNNFREDANVSSGSAQLADYKGSGYDRGHLAPAGDMSFSHQAMSESFFLSNMAPQHPSFNRGIWRSVEELVRQWAQQEGRLYVVTGSLLDCSLRRIGPNRVTVPDYNYKVVLDYHEPEFRMIALLLRNEKGSGPLSAFVIPVDSLEKLAGVDFFPFLPDSLEEQLEEQATPTAWAFERRPSAPTITETPATTASQCKGTTQSGNRCKRPTKNTHGYCWQHQAQHIPPAAPAHEAEESSPTRCTATTQSGSRCKRMTKNSSGRCWQHE